MTFLVDSRTQFQRTPRRSPPLPTTALEIAAPPAEPPAPSSSLVPLLLPVGGIGLSLALSLTLAAGNAAYLLVSGPVMLLSVAGGVYGYVRERGRHTRALAERQQRYQAYLARQRQAGLAWQAQQCQALWAAQPDLADGGQTALAYLFDPAPVVEQLPTRLWTRAPGDGDFLRLRLGVGTVPASFPTTVQAGSGVEAPDPLRRAAQALAAELAQTPGAPVSVSLAEASHLALLGPRPAQVATARALLAHLALHHAPAEVSLAVSYPAGERADWRWTRWLPHVWNAPATARRLAEAPAAGSALLADLYDWGKARPAGALPALVVVLADEAVTQDAGNAVYLRWLLGQGPRQHVFGLWLCATPLQVPRECGAVVDAGANTLHSHDETTLAYQPDTLDGAAADWLARGLTRIQPPRALAGLPATLPLLAALEATTVETLPLLDWWRDHDSARSLAVPVGVREDGRPLQLDLHERGHGPHGLVAGMTRSGKTTFLSAFLALLAAGYHPHAVAILAIDYKGGDMIRDLQGLPHLLGVLTNLEPGLMQRALLSLKAELQRRQTVFNQAGVGNIYDYQRLWRAGQVTEPLPHLVLVADEFAELVKEQPEFISELVSTARVGGSLGVHLILATQQPAGVVNDQIWGNARFRIAFKLANTEHSRAVLKQPDAALITVPGRGYLQVGENEVYELWQAAYGGAPYQPETGPATPDLALVALDGTRRVVAAPLAGGPVAEGSTQLQALVARIRQVAQEAGIAPLPGPWLPPLAETLSWAAVQPADWWARPTWPAAAPLAPVVGLVDDPAHLRQAPLRLDLTQHLLIYGAPGSGKTTLAQTLALGLAGEHAPDQVALYLVGRQWGALAGLPHVAALIRPDEPERLGRLAAWLRQVVAARSIPAQRPTSTPGGETSAPGGETATARGGNFPFSGGKLPVLGLETAEKSAPALVVIVDGYAEMSAASPRLADTLAELSRESRAGLHLVLTAHAVNEIPPRLAGNAGQAVALEMHEANDYPAVVGRTEGLRPARGVRGRGLVRSNPPLEFQTAQPDLSQVAALAEGAVHAPRMRELPARVLLADLAQADLPATAVPLGLDPETLEPVVVDLWAAGPYFVITGAYASGKTTLLRAWLTALTQRLSPAALQLYLVGESLRAFRAQPQTAVYAEDEAGLDALWTALTEVLEARYQQRRASTEPPEWNSGLLLAVDDLDQVRRLAGDRRLTTWTEGLRRYRGLGLVLLAAGPSGDLISAYDPLSKLLREAQTGVVLGSSEAADLALLGLRLPPGETGRPLHPGRGYYGRRGRGGALQSLAG